jgi:protein-S-isoprenylcysteine O-methyltransferase Ste14
MFVFAYGVVVYVVFLLSFLYAIGFVENWVVAFTIDGTTAVGGGLGAWFGNACLLGLFAAQHSLMARPGFKRAWTRILPPAMERSTFVLASSLLLMLLFLFWTPIPGEVWNVGVNPVGFAFEMLSYVGWAIVLVATFQLDHFELFGLKQVFFHQRGEPLPAPRFEIPPLYRWVRHPIYLGFLLAFWSTPRMTLGHLLFAVLTTGYVLVAIRLEEGDLMRMHRQYRAYQARVPMLLPLKPPLPPERE